MNDAFSVDFERRVSSTLSANGALTLDLDDTSASDTLTRLHQPVLPTRAMQLKFIHVANLINNLRS